jgi:hypothetical protein
MSPKTKCILQYFFSQTIQPLIIFLPSLCLSDSVNSFLGLLRDVDEGNTKDGTHKYLWNFSNMAHIRTVQQPKNEINIIPAIVTLGKK